MTDPLCLKATLNYEKEKKNYLEERQTKSVPRKFQVANTDYDDDEDGDDNIIIINKCSFIGSYYHYYLLPISNVIVSLCTPVEIEVLLWQLILHSRFYPRVREIINHFII